jgi:hypothetical protein
LGVGAKRFSEGAVISLPDDAASLSMSEDPELVESARDANQERIPLAQRLSLTYRVRGEPGEMLDVESVFRDAKLSGAERPWRSKGNQTDFTELSISIAENAIEGAYDPNHTFDPLDAVLEFGEFCRKRFEALFDRKDIATHELFVGFFLQDPNESAMVWVCHDRLDRLQSLGLSLAMCVYQHESHGRAISMKS